MSFFLVDRPLRSYEEGEHIDSKIHRQVLRLFGLAKQMPAQAQAKLAHSRLEKGLAKRMETMYAARDAGVTPGSPQMVELWNQIDTGLTKYCQDQKIERRVIEAQVPGLVECFRLSHTASSYLLKDVAAYVIGGLLVCFAIGVALGVTSWGYHLIARH